MADIKTKDSIKGTIKTLDKAAIAGQRMKQAYVQTKEKAEHSTHAQKNSAEEYAADRFEGGADRVTHEAAYQFDKQGRKGVEATKQNISKAKDGIRQFKEKRKSEALKNQSVRTPRNKGVKAMEQTEKTVKQSARSSGKKTIKMVGKGSAKTAQKTVKTAEQTAKESKTETQITETDDGHGNIVQTETTVTRTYLYITVSHKTVDEMAAQYNFNEEQKGYLAELLKDENNSLWSQVLYGITGGDGEIVTVALSQVGNVGGQPYLSWYGFNSRVEWCACFVSWCANECGYIDAGVIPKFADCVNGVDWFKDRGGWLDNSAEPSPGMIIFFDWNDENGQDGKSDHVGIVEKVENGIVYTVEGNSSDSCRENHYVVGYYEILGYGVPQY